MYLRRQLFVFFFVLIGISVFAQEKIGLITDGILAVNQARNNPALMVDQKPWLSINVVGAHAYARTNFIKIQDARLRFGLDNANFTYSEPTKSGRAFSHVEVLGPSATINIRRHAIGIHSSLRFYANVNKMPAIIGQIIGDDGVENIPDGSYLARNARLKQMSWAEFGLSYGTIVYQRGNRMLNAGLTLNRIIGIQQANFIIKSAEVDVEDGNAILRNLDGKYSYADPAWASGKGWGLNLGVNYKKSVFKDILDDYFPHSRRSSCKHPTYRYTIGASLIDLGYSRFNANSRQSSFPDTTTVDNLEDAKEEALGVESGQFTAILPTALSIQADYSVQDYVFISAFLIQKISLPSSFGIERANTLAIAPRFESKWLSISMPVSMANYITPQLGVYVRMGYLAIGTDHLSPFLFKRDIRAADLYVYLNIPIHKGPECKNKPVKEIGKWFCPAW